MSAECDELLSILQSNPTDPSLLKRILSHEKNQSVDLNRDVSLLKGVWPWPHHRKQAREGAAFGNTAREHGEPVERRGARAHDEQVHR